MPKPDFYVLGSSTKGVSLNDPEWLNIFNLHGHEHVAKMSPAVAWTDEGWTRRCVDVRAKAIAALPFVVHKGDMTNVVWKAGEEAPEELAWLDLFDYLYRAEASLALVGAAYAMKEGTFNKDGIITKADGLSWINPTSIKPCFKDGKYGPDERGNFRYYERSANERKFQVPRSRVLGTFQPSPFVEQGPGSADARSANMHSQILHDLAEYTSGQLRSGLVKKTVWVADKDARQPDELTVKRWQRWVRRNILGTKPTPDDPMVMQGLSAQEVGSDLSDLHSDVITRDAREAIASTLGVPHSLVMSNAANYATAKSDQLSFMANTVVPQARLLAHAINQQLLMPLGYHLEFEPHKTEVMQQSELEKAQAIALAVGGPVLSVNEGRELLGYEPIQGQDVVAGQPQEVRSADTISDTKNLDIQRWRTKINRKGRDVKFTPDALADYEADIIRERLATGADLDEVFRPPFVGF